MELRIVVVDRCAEAADALCLVLGLSGVEAIATCSADEALRLGAELRPHAIFISERDLHDTEGAELAYRLRQRWPALYVGIVTTSERAADHARAFDAGADSVSVKPLDAVSLEGLLARVAARFSYGRYVEETRHARDAGRRVRAVVGGVAVT